ncbi:SDR family NAD(P)-dependent oxidoreductase [Arthrobacter sp. H41]|uniref:SDR family NAD(P)-dependent oxidoreductase n=1 Tax=Arthrobacter sp. H41 TaxID=1312978 RepID=UPI0004B0584E|nr:SDR family NAD(P)-dependent oxidoreductase [Arthrobacter sp. H41]
MRLPPFTFTGGTAVVTGAAGGMGEHLARGLAERGCALVLIDRDGAKLDAVAASLRSMFPSQTVGTHVVDLSDGAAVVALAEDILESTPSISLLVNNAGVALAGRFEQIGLDDFDWVLNVNFRAPVLLTHYLLPRIPPGGHLVNVSSLFGLVAPSGQTAYSSSKFALRGFTEALRNELAPRGIGVTSVHPGGVKTGIALNARVAGGLSTAEQEKSKQEFNRLLTFPAGRAAELILDAVHHRRPRLLIGASAKIPDVVARIAPGSFGTLERGAIKAASLMNRRKSRGGSR